MNRDPYQPGTGCPTATMHGLAHGSGPRRIRGAHMTGTVTTANPAADTEVRPAAGYRRCPVCGSWETTRHAEAYQVWFSCNRCGAVFT